MRNYTIEPKQGGYNVARMQAAGPLIRKHPSIFKAAGTTQSAEPRAHILSLPPMLHKKLQRLRFNWFVLGALFGVGSSFFMNALVTTVVLPQYEAFAGRESKPLNIADLDSESGQPLLPLALSSSGKTAVIEVPIEASYPRNVALKINSGDTLIDLLIAQHVQEQEAHNVIAALRKAFNPGQLRVGQKIQMTLARHEQVGDKAAVQELAIKLPNLSTVELERLEDGSFSVAAVKEPTTRELRRATGKVRSSITQAAQEAGIPARTVNELIQAFAYDVDFQRDIHPGDTIEVLTQREVTKDGRVGATGQASYAKLTLRGKAHEIYRFKNTAGIDGWYDARGNSVKKSLLRTPIHAARMSSGFGMRRHPVLGYNRMHRGLDFAAGTGTPILAAGDGIIKIAGWHAGYGNYVRIQHNGTYATAYGHASRIARGIRPGVRVKQGQVIAYVGSTGMSTGAHLHYEVLQNGAQVNPAAQRFNTAVALAGRELQQFKSQSSRTKAQFAKLNPNSSIALDAPKPVAPKPIIVAPDKLAMR
jgi:murein DD-endopeptidase MepM/ murein hydrolase activator NlpD